MEGGGGGKLSVFVIHGAGVQAFIRGEGDYCEHVWSISLHALSINSFTLGNGTRVIVKAGGSLVQCNNA